MSSTEAYGDGYFKRVRSPGKKPGPMTGGNMAYKFA